MSFSSFYSGLAGLQANSSLLGVVGNNLANLNTLGFKASRITFADVYSTAAGFNGAGNPMQVGRGIGVSAIDQLFNQGSLQNTSLLTDLSIQGNGFFVLSDASTGVSYTRAGNFTFDDEGFLVAANGKYIQGYTQADANGRIPASGTLNDIQIPVGRTAPPRATTSLQATMNLNVGARVDDPATTNNEAETYANTITVYDSMGERHNLTITMTPVDTNADGTLDQWTYDLTVPGEEVAGGTAGTPFSLGTGTVQFDANGVLVAPAGSVTLNVPGWANGAAAQAIDWQLFDANGDGILTGYAAPSSTSTQTQDGYGSGVLRTLTVDQEGLISGIFTNGVTLELARVAVATFNNSTGLLRSGANQYLQTNASGEATTGAANSGGRGLVISNALELSNVDMTGEFTNLIISERGYQANSRTITTTDQLLQEALNLKR